MKDVELRIDYTNSSDHYLILQKVYKVIQYYSAGALSLT